jgi:sterol desaturase/sphingolipid hydroxylase (fatty acid hydroxylase superfamily)
MKGFHKKHHTFSDPSSWGAFSVGPMESVLSYWMLPALCQTTFKIWAPINVLIVTLFVLQNCYLHCGVRIEWLEYYMTKLKMDTSSFHNTHHLLSKGNYGGTLRFSSLFIFLSVAPFFCINRCG